MIDAAYNAWADATLLAFLLAFLRALPERPPKVDAVLAHLAVAGETWLARLGDTPPPPDLWPILPFEESARRLAAMDARLLEPWGERTVRYRNSTGTAFENTVTEITAHVLNHATYHRGEIAGLLLAADLEPPVTDYIAYLRNARHPL